MIKKGSLADNSRALAAPVWHSRSTGTIAIKYHITPQLLPGATAVPQGTGVMLEELSPHLVVMGDDWGDLAAREHHVLPWQLINHPSTGVQCMVEGIVATVTPVPALKSTGFLHRQDLLVNSLSLATQAHCELGRKRTHGNRVSPEAGVTVLQGAGGTMPYLVSDDCLILVHPRVQLPAAKLAPPATSDGTAANPT